MSKLLTVFGATGQQGGSLLRYALKHSQLSKQYRFRGVTRDVSKPESSELQGQGVEMVQADMSDPKSVRAAVEGAYTVFAMTNFWETASASTEIAQGKAIADAAVAESVSLLIWSTLPNVTQMTAGKLSGVKHFDSKAEVEIYIRGLDINSAYYMPAFYMQNYLKMFKPKPDENGTLIFAQTWNPDTQIPLIDITDTGKFLTPILLSPSKYNHTTFTAATAYYTQADMISAWTKVTGKQVIFKQIPGGTTAGNFSAEMVRSLKESSGLIKDYSYYGPSGKEDLAWTLAQMEEQPTDWEEFVRRHEPWF